MESFRPSRSGAARLPAESWTLDNYLYLLHPQYARFFVDSLVLSAIASLIALALAYPTAHMLARTASRQKRRRWLYFLISALFLDALVRTYAVSVLFGPSVMLPILSRWLGILGNNNILVQTQVAFGLLYFMIPVATLSLIGPIENINPKLCEAALTLGAPRWKSILVTDVALSAPALLSTFLLAFSLCMSAFIIPLILGRGFILFAANLIYERFSELADFQSGAALSMLALLFSLAVVYLFTWIGRLIGGVR